MYSSAAITCIANPEYSSGEAILAMEELIQEQLGDNLDMNGLGRLSRDESGIYDGDYFRHGVASRFLGSLGSI